MKIAIRGIRGIPARYGGFETLADQLSARLVERGHAVTVYCRKPFTTTVDVFDRRIRRIVLPTLSSKYFDTLFHTLLSVLHVIFTEAAAITSPTFAYQAGGTFFTWHAWSRKTTRNW